MTYQIRPLFQQILHALGRPLSHYDHNFPIQIKTVATVRRLPPQPDIFIGVAILPGHINTLIRPKTFAVETTSLVEGTPITTYSIVVMDAAGDLRLVEGLTIDHTDTDGLDAFTNQVAALVEGQAMHNLPTSTTECVTLRLLHDAATRISHTPAVRWAGWVVHILETLQDHADPTAYGKMLAELSLAIEVWELDGTW